MGITGLLPFLENATKPCHVSDFRGGTAAIDTYCWLHKGANACVEQLALGQETDIYINYCLKYVKLLQRYDIHPILVFDGKNLPAKAETERKRRENRRKARQIAAELLRTGQSDKARSYLKQCIDVTPDMASALMKAARKLNVDCIVAPYESDAQLAFFSLKGVADVIITEDSDLILFGCKNVLYKLDLYGNGQLVESEKINDAMKLKPSQYSFDKFRFMCILSGCDYLSSLAGIGLKKALKFMSLTVETNPQIFLEKIPRYLNMFHLEITDEYKTKFMEALATFCHQTIYDPFKRKLSPLSEPETVGTDKKYCNNVGELFDDETALQIALGNLSPNNLKQLDNWDPSEMKDNPRSIWCNFYSKTKMHKQRQIEEKIKVETKKLFTMQAKSENNEQIKEIESECIEKELSFYESKPNIVEIVEEIKEPEPEPIIIEDTPNPFAKKNKISKFKPSQSIPDSNVIVRSKFFCEKSEEVEELPLSQGSNIENDIDSANRIDMDESPSTSQTTTIVENEVVETKEVKKSDSNKKLNVGRCRTVGLKRKSSQQTIHSFFSKMKKP